jgi:hypothetical protein
VNLRAALAPFGKANNMSGADASGGLTNHPTLHL